VVADADLPVWSIKPNWVNGIREKLSWLTDVLASSYGTEQRRALRLSPRREFEMTFNPVDEARSYFDLWLHRMGSFEFMVPLFHDSGKMTAAIAAGAVTVPFDTSYREFVVGGLAIISGDDPFTFDKVAITAIGANDITVAAGGVTRAWPKGTRIHPLRRSRISAESLLAAITNHVGEATLQFELNQGNDIPDEGVWDTMYLGYPIIEIPPNRRENLDLSFNRNSLVLDNDHGLRALADDAGRAFTVQVDNRMMVGRAEHWAFRQMLYRLRGQQSPVWMPTFNRDIELSQAALAANAYINVKKIGYAYTGGAIDGRQHLMLPGGLMAKISGTGAPPSAAEEHLTLTAGLGTDLPAGTFGSFVDTCRLASDDIEIMHHTDTDGAAECNMSFRSFRDPRTAPDPNDYPIPASVTSLEACGVPAEDACVNLDSGWWAKITWEFDVGFNNPDPLGIGDDFHVSRPHRPPGFGLQFYRGGVHIAAADMVSADNYTDHAFDTIATVDYQTSMTTYYFLPPSAIPRGPPGFATDPFVDGDPDDVQGFFQFDYFAFSPEYYSGHGGGLMRFTFQRNGGSPLVGTVVVGDGAAPAYVGTQYIAARELYAIGIELSL
jgi:hypothetical protein